MESRSQSFFESCLKLENFRKRRMAERRSKATREFFKAVRMKGLKPETANLFKYMEKPLIMAVRKTKIAPLLSGSMFKD